MSSLKMTLAECLDTSCTKKILTLLPLVMALVYGAAADQLGNTSSRLITKVKQC